MKDGLLTWKFWKDALERALATGVQAGVAAVPMSTTLVQRVDWAVIGGTAALAALLSLGKSVIASRVGRSDSASLVDPDR